MESNPLLAALQSNYGDGTPPPPDPNTVKGLLAFCKLWLEGEVETHELNNPCMAMSGRLKVGARDTEKDLQQNPDLVEERRAPIERMAEAYWTIAEILDRLPGLAADNDVEAFEDAIEHFSEERQAVLDCNAEIERSLSGEYRMCPRCGSDDQEEEICPTCDLVRLYPDPAATEYDRSKTAVLPPIYGKVNRAYDEVMSGESSLHVVLDAVDELEQYLVDVQKGYRQVAEMEVGEGEGAEEAREGQEVVRRILRDMDRAFTGIERLRRAQESLQMADLSRGWDTIFDAAADIQRSSNRFAKAHGFEALLGGASDSVQFSGD